VVGAARAGELSVAALRAAFCWIEGRDPAGRSKEDLAAWLATKPDNELTNTLIELATKQPPPPPLRVGGRRCKSKRARRRIARRRECLEVDGVVIIYDGTTAKPELNEDDPLGGVLVFVVGDHPVSATDVAADTGLPVRNLAALNAKDYNTINKHTVFLANASIVLESDPESDNEDGGGSDEDSARGDAAAGAVGLRGGGDLHGGGGWKGRASTSRRLGTALRGARGEVNPAALFFGENMSIDARLQMLGETPYNMPKYKTL
jgi:hypothetical protein